MADLIKNYKKQNTMKKNLIVIFCFALTIKATAQADKVILDNVFQNINKTTIPTGYLQDYGVAFVNKESYNGLLTNSNATHSLALQNRSIKPDAIGIAFKENSIFNTKKI